MALAPNVDLNCFADPEVLDPLSDRCAACSIQAECEHEIMTRAQEAKEAKKEAQSNVEPVFNFKPVSSFAKAATGLTPPVTSPSLVRPPATAFAPAPQAAPIQAAPMLEGCPGLAPVQPAPRQPGEKVWARLGKNMALGGLERVLVEAAQVAADERLRPVGPWGREDDE